MLLKVEGYKFNWIDINDIYVGYDTSTSCCEDANWFVHPFPVMSEHISDFVNNQEASQDGVPWEMYDFDPKCAMSYDGVLDDGGVAIFRLLHKEGGPDMYLHLYNAHNGWYGHGFESNTILGDGGL